jgi:pyrroline-5-carboxylate reductase
VDIAAIEGQQMSDKTVGFIGGGRITRVFLGGWARAGQMPASVIVSDTDSAVLARLKQSHGAVETVTDNSLAAAQNVVFLALHPPVIADAMGQVKSSLKSGAILASLAPKLTFAKLSGLLDGFDRLARVIPNAPSIVGAGFNPMAFSNALGDNDRAVVRGLLAPLGTCCETAEEKLEAYALLTGMGPTYFWPLLYELMTLGESFGLSRSEAESAVQHMLSGTVDTMLASGLSAGEVQDLVPAKPLADVVPIILDAYRTKLKAVFEKIKP